jgi:hypothetical protein
MVSVYMQRVCNVVAAAVVAVVDVVVTSKTIHWSLYLVVFTT